MHLQLAEELFLSGFFFFNIWIWWLLYFWTWKWLLYFQNWKWIHLKGKVGKKAGRSLKQNKKRQEEPEIRQSCECARVIIIFVSLKTRITLAELLLFFFFTSYFLKKKTRPKWFAHSPITLLNWTKAKVL